MEHQTNAKLAPINHDLWSKLNDGILASGILFLIWIMVALAIRPISVLFGPQGC
jgi:hypothetical protein